MPLVCCKIIGDGKSTDTAFRTAIQSVSGLRILNEAIPVGKDGKPLQPFSLLDVHDDDAPLLKGQDFAALPKAGDVLDKSALSQALALQSCNVDLSAAQTPADVIAVLTSAAVAAVDTP